jgi:hypothetical protein
MSTIKYDHQTPAITIIVLAAHGKADHGAGHPAAELRQSGRPLVPLSPNHDRAFYLFASSWADGGLEPPILPGSYSRNDNHTIRVLPAMLLGQPTRVATQMASLMERMKQRSQIRSCPAMTLLCTVRTRSGSGARKTVILQALSKGQRNPESTSMADTRRDRSTTKGL